MVLRRSLSSGRAAQLRSRAPAAPGALMPGASPGRLGRCGPGARAEAASRASGSRTGQHRCAPAAEASEGGSPAPGAARARGGGAAPRPRAAAPAARPLKQRRAAAGPRQARPGAAPGRRAAAGKAPRPTEAAPPGPLSPVQRLRKGLLRILSMAKGRASARRAGAPLWAGRRARAAGGAVRGPERGAGGRCPVAEALAAARRRRRRRCTRCWGSASSSCPCPRAARGREAP